MRIGSRWTLGVCFVLAVACTATQGRSYAGEGPVAARHRLGGEELRTAAWTTMDDVIHGLRPEWLRTRGPSSLSGRPEEVQVLIDGIRLGGVRALRSVGTAGVVAVRFYDPISASSRWGPAFGNGAIVITTRASP